MRKTKEKIAAIVLIILVILLSLVSIINGAVNINIHQVAEAINHSFKGIELTDLNERIFMQIRLPKVIMSNVVGASLAVGGVLMQSLFRNPIVEPGLVGTSSGAAFGAALYFVLGAGFNINLGEWTLPFAACIGSMASTALVFYLSPSRHGKNSMVSLLLTGIAINTLFLSGVGFLSYISRDPQARSITFWNLGSLSGSYWEAVYIVSAVTIVCLVISVRYAKQLNALMLGEQEAQLLGVNIKKLRLKVLAVNVIMIAVATSFVGVIGFVGLIVPHLLRMVLGSDNRMLTWSAALLGAALLTASDLVSRTILAPAELPIGIVTSIIGVPVFIILIRRSNYIF